MWKKLSFLISFVLVLSLMSTSYGVVVIGDFEEGDMDGWEECDWEPSGHPTLSFSTTGVTLGSYSLKGVQPTDGFNWFLQKLLVSSTDFMANNYISMDVTRLASEWTRNPDPNQSHWCYLEVRIKADGLSTTSIGTAGAWDSNDPDANATRTVTWDYTTIKDKISPDATSVEIHLATNNGGYTGDGTWYLDNIRLMPGRKENPRNGTWGVFIYPVLRWKDLPPANYDVYFGTDFNDVNDANRASHPGLLYYSENQDPNYYPSAGILDLNYSTTYYWRIDDVTGDIEKGNVWHFTTMRLGGETTVIGDWEQQMDGWTCPDANIALSYSTTGATLNDYSLNVAPPSGWRETVRIPISDMGWGDQLLANNRFSLDVTRVTSEWTGGGFTQVESIIIDGNGIGGTQIGPVGDTNNPDGPGTWDVGTGGWGQTTTLTWEYPGIDFSELLDKPNLVLIISTNSATGAVGSYHFDNARFFDTARASNPSPSDDAPDVQTNPTLSWTPGTYAGKHDVYFGDDFNDVTDANRSNHSQPGLLQYSEGQTATNHSCGILIPGDTYFWRIDEVNDAGPAIVLWKGDIWSFTVGMPKASDPSPADGAELIKVKTQLRWKPDTYAQKHDVYFGNNFNDVNDANRSNHSQPGLLYYSEAQDANYYPVSGTIDLDFEQTYYWRIDEGNDAIYPGLWEGDIWSFTTAPYLTVEDFEKYADTTALKTVWKAKSDIKASSDIVCGLEHSGLQAMAIVYNNSSSRSEAYVDVNTIDNIVGKNWRLKDVKALSLWLHGIPDLRGSYTGSDPYTLEGDGSGINGTKYDVFYYLYAEKAGQITGQVKARVDSIENTHSNAMAGVMLRDTLNPDSIYAATVVTPNNEVKFMIRATAGTSSGAPATVSGITLPHWVRITRSISLTSAEHANDVGGNPDKWEQVGPTQRWPMGAAPLYLGLCVTSSSYGDMCTAELSQVTMQSPVGSGISDPATEKDVGNYVYNAPEAMYVVLQDNDSNGIVYYENKDDTVTQTADWEEWRIDINEFIVQNVDVCDVNTMYIGIGDKDTPSSGSGTMYVDDIRLYRAEFYEPECPSLPPDLVRDGEVDYDDLKMITDNWLISDYEVTPEKPDANHLVAWYRLEQDPCDSANGFDANEYGIKTADYVAGKEGTWALDLKGDANYIDCNYTAADYGIDGNKPRTITAWAKTRSFDEYAGLYEIGGYEQGGQDFSMLTSGEEPNVWRANHEGGPETYDIDFVYPSQNKWVHLAHTYDGTIVKVYADGNAVAARVLNLNTTNVKTFSIGRWTSWDQDIYFDGTVDDVRIYDCALSQANAAYIARDGDTTPFIQPLELLLTPQDIAIDLFIEDPNMINFRDVAEMGKHWGETQVWPTW